MARPRKPTALKKLHGTDQPCRITDNEMSPALCKEIPMAPEGMNEDGKGMWYRVATEVQKLGMLTKIGLPQIERYCHAYQFYRIALSKCYDKKGNEQIVKQVTQSTGNRKMTLNPYWKILNDSITMMRDIEREWGWTPSTATRISAFVNPNEEKEEEQEFDL